MATTVTIDKITVLGDMRKSMGSFTTADKDSTITVATGLNYIYDYGLTLAQGAVGAQQPKLSVSGGTITGTVDDTKGFSGRFFALGR